MDTQPLDSVEPFKRGNRPRAKDLNALLLNAKRKVNNQHGYADYEADVQAAKDRATRQWLKILSRVNIEPFSVVCVTGSADEYDEYPEYDDPITVPGVYIDEDEAPAPGRYFTNGPYNITSGQHAWVYPLDAWSVHRLRYDEGDDVPVVGQYVGPDYNAGTVKEGRGPFLVLAVDEDKVLVECVLAPLQGCLCKTTSRLTKFDSDTLGSGTVNVLLRDDSDVLQAIQDPADTSQPWDLTIYNLFPLAVQEDVYGIINEAPFVGPVFCPITDIGQGVYYTTTSITARSGTTPGSGSAKLYKNVSGTLTEKGEAITVYNSQNGDAIASGSYIQCKCDEYGVPWVDVASCS